MTQMRNSKLSLFLMELIVAIFFFSVSAAICVRLFVSAHFLAQKTENLSNASIWSQNLSEVFIGNNGNMAAISDYFPNSYISLPNPDMSKTTSSLILLFDKEWNIVSNSSDGACYEAILHVDTRNASEVYKDVTDYQTDLKGKAIIGCISILEIKDNDEIFWDIPASKEDVILENNLDIYLGKDR